MVERIALILTAFVGITLGGRPECRRRLLAGACRDTGIFLRDGESRPIGRPRRLKAGAYIRGIAVSQLF